MVASRDEGKVFVVRDGYILYWPDNRRTRRGAAGYAVRSDDPFIGEQLNKLHVAPEGTEPIPPSEWDNRWRKVAADRCGEQWLTDAERADREHARKAGESAKADADAKSGRIADEVPEPDEPVSTGAGSGGGGKGRGRK